MAEQRDLLIIGNGAAGNSAAFAARKAAPEMSIMIFGKENYTEYSAPALPDYLSGELTREKLMVRNPEDYQENDIELHLNDPVDRIDTGGKKVITVSGKEFTYDKLIIATGSFPIQLRRMEGTGLPGNFVTKTIDDIEAILSYGGKSAVIVGSGAIGLEGSMALKARGYEKVTMVEALEWLSMKSLDKETSDELASALESFGVEVLQGESVQGVTGTDKIEGVITSKRTIPCDIILWGIGMRADTELAKSSGIQLGELGGIQVDDHMRTNVTDVYACGDCVESIDKLSGKSAMHLFWEPAQRGGAIAGENAAGGDKAYNGSTAIFLTHKGGLSITAYGKTETSLSGQSNKVLVERKGKAYRRLLFEDGMLVGAQMVNTMADNDLLLDYIERNAVNRENTFSTCKPIDNLDELTVRDVIIYLRKERRAVLKR